MTTRMGLRLAAAVAAGVAIAVGGRAARHSQPPPTARATSSPTTAPVARRTFADPAAGIALAYPASWSSTPAKTAELAVACPTTHALLALDVPAMTVHPLFIPIGLVAKGYLDNLRQTRLPDAVVQETADLKVAGATARRVTARGHAAGGGGPASVDTAVLIVHRGQVYILSCDSDDAAVPVARSALDAAVASVKWTK